MACHDRYGLPLSTSSEAAAAAYRDGVDLMLSAWPGAAEAFDAAIAADPGFRAGAYRPRRACTSSTRTDAPPRPGPRRRASSSRATAPRARRAMWRRWRSAWKASRQSRSICALAHLDEWPRDAMVFVLPMGAFGLFAFSGMADHDQARVDLCERHARHYGDDWFFLTYLGWSHTENGNVGARPRHHSARIRRQARRTPTPCTRWRMRCSRTDRAMMPNV